MEPAMPTSVAALEAEALELSPEERVLLADHLLASLDGEHEIDGAWALEVDRRLAQLDSGGVTLVPTEQDVQRAREAMR
jgi:putative addiction module component (TIGR02574 family)